MKDFIEKLKLKLIKLAEYTHLKFFGHEMSDTMRKFLQNLSWSFFGGIISAGLFFVATILVGRILGPEEYGKYSLVVAIATIFIIPMTLGVDTASMYYIAKEKNISKKNDYLNSALWLVVVLIFSVTSITFLIIYVFDNFIFSFLSVSTDIIKISLVLGIFLALKNIMDSFLRGVHLFKVQSIVKIVESSIIIMLVIIMLNITDYGFGVFVGAISAGYFSSVLIMVLKLKNRFYLTNKYSKKIVSYGVYAVLGSIAGVLLNSIDKILINKFIGQGELGIYNAYSSASVLVVGQLTFVFVNVFFPYISAASNRGIIFKKINKIAKIIFIPVFFAVCLIIFITIFLFGNQYPIDLILIIEFGLLATLLVYFSVLWWFIASENYKGIRFTSINGIIAGIILVVLTFIFRVKLNLYLAVLFLIISVLYGIIIGNIKNIQRTNKKA